MSEQTAPQSGIDRIFNIPESAVGRRAMEDYLGARRPTTDDLLEFGLNMWHADHPAVNYVAANAAAEIALARFKPVTAVSAPTRSLHPSIGLRLLATDIAAAQWAKAEAIREEFRDYTLPARRRQEALNLTVNSLQAQAYRPTMEIAASWFANRPDFYTAEEIQERRRKTLELTVQCCQEVMQWPQQNTPPFNREGKGRMLADLLGGAVLQLSERYLAAPALLRHAGGTSSRVRFGNLGFAAITEKPPYPQIRIRTFFGESSSKTKSLEVRLDDLKLHPDAPIDSTVEALALYSATGELAPGLGRLSDELTARLDHYALTHQQAPSYP